MEPRGIVARTIEQVKRLFPFAAPQIEANHGFLLLQFDDDRLSLLQTTSDVLHLVGTGGAECFDITIEPHLMTRNRRILL